MALNHRVSESTGKWILIATITASSMAFIDGSALNVVLSILQEDLGASGAELLWIVNAYLLMLASLILIGGSLGDHYGRKRIFRTGISIFAGASLVCGLAPGISFLIVARAVQGIGGALMVPGSLAIISASFAPTERGRAIGLWSSASTITTIGGPIIGGILGDAGLWRLVFFINLPLAALSLFALRFVPDSKNPDANDRMDFLGAGLITLGLAGITYGLVTLGDLGVDAGLQDVSVIVSLLTGILATLAFIVVEARSTHPMMNLRLFRSRTFSGTNLMTAFLYGALSGVLFFLPLNLIQVQGYPPSSAGITLLPFALLLAMLSPWAGAQINRFGPRLMLTVGPAIVGIGFFMLSLPQITNGSSEYFTTFFPAIVMMGIGMGITVAPLTTAVMGSVPSSQAGIASGVNNAVTRSAQVLATAVFGAIALVVFSNTLMARLEVTQLPLPMQEELRLEARNLANTSVPEELLDSNAGQTIRGTIQQSFVSTFQLIMQIAAVMAFISALLSAIVIEPRLPDDDKHKDAIASPG